MPEAALDNDFVFRPREVAGGDGLIVPADDPLEPLIGRWVGAGFNAIWRPLQTSLGDGDHTLMVNFTKETLTVTRVPGLIPNRGFLQADIGMIGVTYMDQVSDTDGNALHFEPGIWAVAPQTTDPSVNPTVVRMATIPHGTSIIAQGTASTSPGPPIEAELLGTTSLSPTSGGSPIAEPEMQIGTDVPTRSPTTLPPTITQEMMDNPNTILVNQLGELPDGFSITSTTTLAVDIGDANAPGGGVSETAFLTGTADGPNAHVADVNAIFWIETVVDGNGLPAFLQLQYTQTVVLEFASGVLWPHVTVGTLRRTMSGGPVLPTPGAVPPIA